MSELLSMLTQAGLVVPDFKNSNLAVVKEFAQYGKRRFTGQEDKKVFIIMDGLGYDKISSMLENEPELLSNSNKRKLSKLTTLFPSTTMNVLPSLYSGLTTAEHGVVGTKVFMKYFGSMVNGIHIANELDNSQQRIGSIEPNKLFPKGRIAEQIKERGKRFTMHMEEHIVSSGMSHAAFNRDDLISHMSFDDMLVRIRKDMERGIDYIFGYNEMLDHAEHEYSPSGEQVDEMLRSMLISINRILLPSINDLGYEFVLTADHGQITSLPENTINIDENHKMMEYTDMPPWGESRALFLQIKENKRREFESYMENKFGGIAMVLDSDEAIESGLFGETHVNEVIRYRFGTHLVVPRGYSSFHYLSPGKFPKTYEKIGLHGGLSKEEMYVPLLIC